MKLNHIHRVPNFFDQAKNLRREFEERFQNPKSTLENRFIWDYWYVEDQYNMIRTMAENVFSPKSFAQLQTALVEYGRTHLGCDSITPPWISYYVDGCSQQLHADVPHGPWAYVYSLSPSKKEFTGGETILLKPETLNYWQNLERLQGGGIEMNQLTQKITPAFNQLLVFDPRIPHGVTTVHGTRDPLKARVVIHGWFTHPRPVIEGALASSSFQNRVNELIMSMEPVFINYADLSGSLTLRFVINSKGAVTEVKYLTNTLVSVQNQKFNGIYNEIKSFVSQQNFGKSAGKTTVTIPFLFQSV